MPIYEEKDNKLVPFIALDPGPELYEKEVEHLVWNDFEAFVGEALFPIARQAIISSGGKPDILALDDQGRVIVIEVKRDVDRKQLAQCLEYAGWARLTNLDELASIYDSEVEGHSGPEAFFDDWKEFTNSPFPKTIDRNCRLFLVARDFDARTHSAIAFLQEYRVPIEIIPVSLYQHSTGWRIVNIENDYEPKVPIASENLGRRQFKSEGRRFVVADLIAAGLIHPNEPVTFTRPKIGKSYSATILEDGQFQLSDGSLHRSPSLAAMSAAHIVSYDGWYAWRVPRLGNKVLHDLRSEFLASTERENDSQEEDGFPDSE